MFDFLEAPLAPENLIPVVQLEEGVPDPRYLRLSYSGSLDFHACPRFFQLSKLEAERHQDYQENVTFAYGHAVGEGIQQYLITRSLTKALWAAFLFWDTDYADEDEKRSKSFPEAAAAIIQLDGLCQGGLLDDYEVAYFNGRPAAELSFKICLPHTTYRGYVDLVLRHRLTGELLILELKTSSATWVNHYQYKNSAQAIGYSVVLDKIVPGCTAYSVLYLVQLTKLRKYEVFEFPKTMHQRALWIKNILWDEQVLLGIIGNFGNYGIWPTHGESCTRFGKTCRYMDMCQLTTESMAAPLRENQLVETKEYDFEFTIEELLS